MSDTAHDLDIREQIKRIDRMQEESDKFRAEQRNLMAESQKFERDHALAPWQLVIAAMGAGAALFAAGAAFWKILGH